MTLTQALHHPWLLPPGAERDSQSLPASLAAVNLPESNSDRRSVRSTTHTAGPSTSATEDNEDFSYPMNNLHIRTPALDRTVQTGGADSFPDANQLAGQSSFWGNQPSMSSAQLIEDDSQSSVVPESHPISQDQSRFNLFSQPRPRPSTQVQLPRSVLLQESPPSPPLTDAAMDEVSSLPAFVEESPSSLPDFVDESVPSFGNGLVKTVNSIQVRIPNCANDKPAGHTPLATPLSSKSTASILKRKRSTDSVASQESSDLSPAPESQSDRPATISAFIEAQEARSAGTTPKANKKRVALQGAIPTRSSARLRATQQTSSGSNSPRTPKTTPKARKP
jgi:hypothetical protein